jgi:peptide/nickel transport system permease protein
MDNRNNQEKTSQRIPEAAGEDREKKEERAHLTGTLAEIRFSLYLARKNPLVIAGAAISIISILLAVFSGLIVPPNAWKISNLSMRLCWNNPVINWRISSMAVCSGTEVYPLGTDAYGRNLLQMIILALPLDLETSFEIVSSAFVIGVVLGSAAAYIGGLVDEAIMRITDIFFAFPGIVLAIVILTVFGRTLPNLTVAVLVVWWPIYVRLVRSQVLSEKEKPYVEALRSTGASPLRILYRHILPNSIYPVLVQFTLDIGGVILVFSGLMFLGFSPDPKLPELGNLVSDGIQYVFTAPWLVVFPGLTILVISLGFNLLGDGIRDVLDPRLRR